MDIKPKVALLIALISASSGLAGVYLNNHLTNSNQEKTFIDGKLYEQKIKSYQILLKSLVEFHKSYSPSSDFKTLQKNYNELVTTYYLSKLFLPRKIDLLLTKELSSDKNSILLRKVIELADPDADISKINYATVRFDLDDPRMTNLFLETYEPLIKAIPQILSQLKKDLGTNRSGYNFITK